MRRAHRVVHILIILLIPVWAAAQGDLTAPKLTNNPSFDVIVTRTTPYLSIFNASGGDGKRSYVMQLDKVETFDSPALVEYRDIPEETPYVTSKAVEQKNALDDQSLYYWRVRAVDASGKEGPWATTRFRVDTASDDAFMDLVRVPVKKVSVLSGFNAKNIIDLDDPGQASFWQATPPGSAQQWVAFEFHKPTRISRIWMLSNPTWDEGNQPAGWLKDFVWQASPDGQTWRDIPETQIIGNDTFRNILNFKPVETRRLRLLICSWHGYAPQLNAVTFYSPGAPEPPEVPDKDYVLVVGNQQNGFTFTELAEFIEGLDLGLSTVTVPHYEVSLKMIDELHRKPTAIVLSGNNANYANLPMFEYNGELELIRSCPIPILGICCGHQMTVIAHGYTNVRAMGWSDISALRLKHPTDIHIVRPADPIFQGITSPFTAPEVHSWAVAKLPESYREIAHSGYVQAIKSTEKTLYGEQFHAEIKRPYNQAKDYIVNFLKSALDRRR